MVIRAASAPVSWGIMESIDLPSEYPYSRVLDEIAQAGYGGTELGPYGFLPADPLVLRRELVRRGLTLCSAFVAMHLGDKGSQPAGFAHVERTANLLQQADCHLLILSDEITPARSAVAGRPGEANRLSWSEAEWKVAEDAIRHIEGLCSPRGLRVAFHHHVGTHVETPEEIDRLLSLESISDLGLCLDTGHCAYGGGDPVGVLDRYARRVRCVHLKDCHAQRLDEARRQRLDFHSAVTHGVFAPLGQGMIDFARIVALLRQFEFDGWAVVEMDVLPGGRDADSPLANARAGREFLRKLGV
ncbi:MAG: TIM barrel protein [Terriglobia bacterium]